MAAITTLITSVISLTLSVFVHRAANTPKITYHLEYAKHPPPLSAYNRQVMNSDFEKRLSVDYQKRMWGLLYTFFIFSPVNAETRQDNMVLLKRWVWHLIAPFNHCDGASHSSGQPLRGYRFADAKTREYEHSLYVLSAVAAQFRRYTKKGR